MSQLRVAAVMFEGFEMLDLYGPLEIFCMHPGLFEIVTVAEGLDPLRASGGPATLPDAVLSDGADYDILLVPGGAGVEAAAKNRALVGWLSEAAKNAQLTTSVCTGTVLLAVAGILEGHKATTNKLAFDWVASFAPEVNWQRRARWVESGKVFTASGVSAGIDMTLAAVEHLVDAKTAEEAAYWAEYIRNPDADNDPFAIEKEAP